MLAFDQNIQAMFHSSESDTLMTIIQTMIQYKQQEFQEQNTN